MAMENVQRGEVEEALRVLDRCLLQMRWRLRPPAKRRLALDIVVLCTRLRPVIMVDYGGKMPELQDQLYHLLCLAQKESLILHFLRVMVIEEMVYLVHVKSMLEHMHLSLNMRAPLQFAVLDQGPAKLALLEEEKSVAGLFVSIQELFSSVMVNHTQDLIDMPSQGSTLQNILDETASTSSETSPYNIDQHEGSKINSTVGSLHSDSRLTSKAFELIDLSQCVNGTQISPPTLNGWLLGYPIVYLFSRENVADAANILSSGPIHLFKILICSKVSFGKEAPKEEELMSFSVPVELSSLGKEEPWAETFIMQMVEKMSLSEEIWRYMKLEVTKCIQQSIAL